MTSAGPWRRPGCSRTSHGIRRLSPSSGRAETDEYIIAPIMVARSSFQTGPRQPSLARPGSSERVLHMAARAAAGNSVFNPQDAGTDDRFALGNLRNGRNGTVLLDRQTSCLVNPSLPVPFGRRLRNLRERADLTRKRLADRAEMNDFEIRALERGELEPTPAVLVALAEVLGVTVEQLRDGSQASAASAEPPKMYDPSYKGPKRFCSRLKILRKRAGLT